MQSELINPITADMARANSFAYQSKRAENWTLRQIGYIKLINKTIIDTSLDSHWRHVIIRSCYQYAEYSSYNNYIDTNLSHEELQSLIPLYGKAGFDVQLNGDNSSKKLEMIIRW